MSSHPSRFKKRTTLRELWSDLREAIAGTEKDFTKIPLGKAILLLSIPMVLEMMMESVFVLEAGIICLRLISFGFLIYALGMVMVQSINGAGDTATPIWINIIAFWLAEIPLAWLFTSVLGMGVYGVCYAILIGETTLTMLSMFIFRRGRWKLKVV